MNDVLKLSIILTVVCLVSGLSLGVVSDKTRQLIEEAEHRTLLNSLKVVLPSASHFSSEKERTLENGRTITYYEGYSAKGKLVGYALLGEGQGYQSLLRVLVGIRPDGTTEGVDVLQQAETPGLGARISEIKINETLWSRIARLFSGVEEKRVAARPWFQEQFEGLAVTDLKLLLPPKRGRGIQALTGATITSRALTDAVRESIQLFLESEEGGARD